MSSAIFNMQDVNQVNSMDFEKAKEFAMSLVNSSEARETSKQKAIKMISKAKTSTLLAFGMANFILAFEELEVIK